MERGGRVLSPPREDGGVGIPSPGGVHFWSEDVILNGPPVY